VDYEIRKFLSDKIFYLKLFRPEYVNFAPVNKDGQFPIPENQ